MTDNVEQLENVSESTVDNTTNNTVLNTTIDTTIPDKFKVVSEDGSVDYKSTVAKLTESYSYLEKKVGTGDVVPKSVDEYKIEREDFDFETFKADESNQAFLSEAHKKGITNAQLDFLIQEYDKRAVDLVSTSTQLDTDTAVSTLQSEWGKDYESNIFNAIKAAKSAGLTQEQINDPNVGNNVAVIKALAYFGSQIAEDKPVNIGTPVSEDITSLMRSEAFFNPRHPDHKATKERIDSYYNNLRNK